MTIYAGKDRIAKVKDKLIATRIKHKAHRDAMASVVSYEGNAVCVKLDDKIVFPDHFQNVNANLIKQLEEDIKEEEGFYYLLAGVVGCGKTLMANIIARTIYNIYGFSFRFRSASKLYSEYLDLMDSKGSDKYSLLRKLRHALCGPCIIFDDIGDEQPDTEKAHKFIGTLISARYDAWQKGNILFTIDTTNLSGRELRDTYGDRVTDRLLEMNLFIHMKKTNFRGSKFNSIKGNIDV